MGAARRRTVAPRAGARWAPARRLALFAVVALVLAAASCDGDGDGDSGTAPEATAPGATGASTGGGATTTTAAPAPAVRAGCAFVDGTAPELTWVAGRDAALAVPMASPVTVAPDGAEAAVRRAVDGGCGFVVAYGGRLEPAVAAVAAAAPTLGFVLVDVGDRPSLAAAPAGPPTTAGLDITNVLVLDVRLDQAAFLAGFLAASASATHTVAVVAPGDDAGASAVATALAAAFRAGVRYRDGLIGATTTVADAAGPPADVVFGLDGRPIAELAVGGARVITVDGDACARTPAVCPEFLSGLAADVGPALQETARLAADGRFRGGTRSVTVASGGIRLAPVPPDAGLAGPALAEMVAATAGVVRGEVRVSPRDVPA